MEEIAILGAGNGGYACSADLSLAGYKVNLYELPKFKSNLEPILNYGGIRINGEARVGFAKLNKVTTDIKEAIEGVPLILVVVPSFAHRTFAEICVPHLEDGQKVVFLGKGGGVLEFTKVMKDQGSCKDILLGETCTLPYSCRRTNLAEVHIYIVVKELLTAVFPARRTEEIIGTVKCIYPAVIPAKNVLETILTDINAMIHPAPTILNAGRIEYTHGDFFIYLEGLTPAVAKIIKAIDKERMAIMRKFGLDPVPIEDVYFRTGFGPKGDIVETITKADDAAIKGPATLTERYITEDVPYGLVTISTLGKLAKIPTPGINSLITLASIFNQIDYLKEGRTLERLGISGMSLEDLQKLVTG